MLFENIQPFVRQALVGHLNKTNTQDVHVKIKTPDCRLFYILSGSGYMTIENTSHPLSPGTAILFKAGTEYVWEIDDVKYYSVNFDYTHAFSHIKTTFHPIHSTLFQNTQIIECPYFEDVSALNAPIVIPNAPSLGQFAGQITTEYCIDGAYTDLLLSTLLKSSIITMLRMYTNEKGTRERAKIPLVQSIIAYINIFYDTPISNESIASHFHFNSAYLRRVFKVHTGNTMHEFLISRRIVAAMEMLRSQNISVSDVAYKCGFQSLHHFTKTFKNRVKMTPSAYRHLNI